MGRYGRRVAGVAVVVTGAPALATLACSGSDVADPTVIPVPLGGLASDLADNAPFPI